MQERKGFSELIREGYQLQLPLPDIPKVKTTRRGEHCKFCHGVHMNVVDFINCREANT